MSNQLSVPAKKRLAIKTAVSSALTAGVAEMLPEHISPKKMSASFAGSLTREPKLLGCTPTSFVEALVLSASAALPPDGYHAHLIPFGNKVVFIPDYKGLIQLALRNGVVIDAYAVYEKDEFEYRLGTDPVINHVPCEEADRGDLRAAYAVARFGEQRKFVVATRAEVKKRRNASRASTKSDSPWVQWEDQMWIKTAVKMLAKFIPRSAGLLTNAVNADDAAEMGTQRELAKAVALEVIDITSNVARKTDAMFDGAIHADIPAEAPAIAEASVSESTTGREPSIDELRED